MSLQLLFLRWLTALLQHIIVFVGELFFSVIFQQGINDNLLVWKIRIRETVITNCYKLQYCLLLVFMVMFYVIVLRTFTTKIHNLRTCLPCHHCGIIPSRFLTECHKSRLNQDSFVLLCFALFAFWVVFSLCISCTVYARQHICYSMYMLKLSSVGHTGESYKNGWS